MDNNIQASFTVEIKEVSKTLMALSRLSGKLTKTTIIKIRVLNTAIEITSKGITKRIEANTNGEADISLPVSLLKAYLTAGSGTRRTFTFRKAELLCGGSIYNSDAIVVKPVFSDMAGVIPTNLSHKATLDFWLNKSKDEIKNLGLTLTIDVAKRTMQTNIKEALVLLKEYGVNYEDLELIVKNKINLYSTLRSPSVDEA
jgi:hypothetical protein